MKKFKVFVSVCFVFALSNCKASSTPSVSLSGTGNEQTTLQCEDLFQSYDANGDGTVTKEEFYTAWDSGVDPQRLSVLSLRDKSRYQSKKVSTFYDLDVNEDLELTMQEFCARPDAVIEHESQK